MTRLALLALLVIPACRNDGAIVAPSAPAPTRVIVALSRVATDGATGDAVEDPPTVLIADRSGRNLAGVAVRFAIASGGGSVGDTVAVTNSNGVAKCARWILGPIAGQNTLVVRVDGADSLVFSARARVAQYLSLQFDLQRVGIDSLPITLGTALDTTYLLTGGWYALSGDGHFTLWHQNTARAGTYSHVEFSHVSGTYRYFDVEATIRFYRDGKPFATGTVLTTGGLSVRYVDFDYFADEDFVLSPGWTWWAARADAVRASRTG